jgi:hypothetical protein
MVADRRENALSQLMYLVKMEKTQNDLTFNVLGTSSTIYKVKMTIGKVPKCSCPDSVFRKVVCKHMYFVCIKVLLKDETFQLEYKDSIKETFDIVTLRLPHLGNLVLDPKLGKEFTILESQSKELTELKNDECCICLESLLDTPGELLVCIICCCGIHNTCWKKWKVANKHGTCVYCRSKIKEHSTSDIFDCLGNLKI